MKIKSLLRLFSILLLGLYACDDDKPCQDPSNPDCENFDPCFGNDPASADFDILSIRFGVPDSLELVKQAKHFRTSIAFRAKMKDDPSYKFTWYLGSEIIHEPFFYRIFSESTEERIPITLIVEKTDTTNCLQDDEKKDTLTQYIEFYENWCEALTIGNYKVKFSHLEDSSIVKIRKRLDKHTQDTCPGNLMFIGFDPNKYVGESDTLWRNYHKEYVFYSKIIFHEGDGESTGRLRNGGFFLNDKTWKVEAKYQIDLGEYGKFANYEFKGRKIN